MKHYGAVAACALAICLALGGLAGCGSSGEKASVQSVSLICGIGSTSTIDRFAGVVEAKSESKIVKDTDKSVAEIKVAVGDKVEKDQVLFSYDQQSVQLSYEKADLEVQQLQNTIDTKTSEKATLERQSAGTSGDTKLSYTLQIQQLEIDIAEAQYNLASKQKDLEAMKALLDDVDVKSPVTGTVRTVNTPSAADQSDDHVLIVVTEEGEYRVKGYVNEANTSQLREGMGVVVRSRVDSTVQKGTITTIDLSSPASNSSQSNYDTSSSDDTQTSSKYPFYITLDDNTGFIIGQHVYIEPDYGQEDSDGTTINLPAYYINDVDSSPWVWAENSRGKLEKRSITLGDHNEDEDTWVVTDGLAATDHIAFPDDTLKAGMTCEEYNGAASGDDTSYPEGDDGSDTSTDGNTTNPDDEIVLMDNGSDTSTAISSDEDGNLVIENGNSTTVIAEPESGTADTAEDEGSSADVSVTSSAVTR